MDSGTQINNRDAGCELFSKQLLSTNWLKKSAVKREVSLVSFRNFLCSSYRMITEKVQRCYTICRWFVVSVNGIWVAIFRLFIIIIFDARQGISLTTWMVVCEIDKWNTNFQFFFAIFVVRHIEWELVRNGILLFWRKQVIPFALIVFFEHLFLWRRFISF